MGAMTGFRRICCSGGPLGSATQPKSGSGGHVTGHDSPADLGLWGRIRSAFRRLHVHLHRNPITALVTKVVITVLGVLVIGAGLVMMVTPGPGIVGIIVGLGILATEWHWAERWMHAMKERAQAAADVARDMDPAVRRRRLLLTALGLVVIVGARHRLRQHLRLARLRGGRPGTGSRASAARAGPSRQVRAECEKPGDALESRSAAAVAVRQPPAGDWRSGSALRSHRRGHWFEPSIAHRVSVSTDVSPNLADWSKSAGPGLEIMSFVTYRWSGLASPPPPPGRLRTHGHSGLADVASLADPP